MKHILLAISVFAGITCFAQSIERSEIDKFTGQKRVETDNVTIYGALIGAELIKTTLRAVDNDYVLVFTGYSNNINIMNKDKGVGAVTKDEKLILLLDDNSTVTATSIGNQNYHLVSSAQNIDQMYIYQYRIAKEDVAKLAGKSVKSIRLYFENSYRDLDVKDRNAEKFKSMCTVFNAEINKN